MNMEAQAPKRTLGLVGNPNCGKTTLFNALTGARQKVGNWPGVTVERKTGSFKHRGKAFEVVDLPGTYALDVQAAETSLDELVAREYVLSHRADVIINIIDASNLERNLYLTTQLLEMEVPLVLVLNMMDVAATKGEQISVKQLSTELGCPVFPLVAAKSEGLEALKDYLATTADFSLPQSSPRYPRAFEDALQSLQPLFVDVHPEGARWRALKALEGDPVILGQLPEAEQVRLETTRTQLELELEDELDIVAADTRYGFIAQLASQVVSRQMTQIRHTRSDKIDQLVLNRVLGIPFFFLIMYLMFMFTINVGGIFIDFFDGMAETIFVHGVAHLLHALGAPVWLEVILAKGFGGGVQTVAAFVPIIGFLFLFLSVLEDSGYMARAAFVMDRFMKMIGLPGKSFVPLIVGFGCNVPAVMATRTLEGERDRLMTMAMTPFMSCGARLPVYALFAVAFFPQGGQNMVFMLYLLGIGAAILTGLVLKKTLLPGQGSPFIMELPPYHLPTLKGVLLHTWGRLQSFVFRAGKVIIPMVLILNLLNATGTDGRFGHENTEGSLLSSIGKTITPVFAPMGMQPDNWPAAVGVFTGVLAKEAVVGTLNALYTQLSDQSFAPEEDEEFSLAAGMLQAFQTIPEKFFELSDRLLDPLGIQIFGEDQTSNISEVQAVSTDTMTTMVHLFGSTAAAFSYQVLILLYFPCVAVLGAISREAGWRWACFIAGWSAMLGYGAAVMVYQVMMFAAHPLSSLLWILAVLASVFLVLTGMKHYSKSLGNPITHLAARMKGVSP